MLAAAAVALSSILAAGSVVDVGIKGEARTSFLSADVADGFGNTLSAVGLTPTVRAAYQGQGLVLDANYGPNLSLIYPSSDYFLLMHRWGGRVDWTASPRLRLSVDTTGAAGDLDAGSAVRERGGAGASNLGQVLGGGNLTQFPFLDIVSGADASYRYDARTTLSAGIRADITGSPSPGEEEQLILPPQFRPEANVGAAYLLTPTDSLQGNLLFKSAIIADKRGVLGKGGGYVGLTPSLSYNRTLMNGVVATGRGGWLTAIADEARGRDFVLVGLPLVDGRLQASVNLSGEAAIEGTVLFGVTPSSDPLGGLIEERITTGVQGAWRVNRDLTLTTSATAFATLFALGGNVELTQESSTSVGGSFGVAYNLTEWVSVTGEALSNMRVVSDKFGALSELAPDLTVVVGLTGTFNAFHEGERPAGTDPRPGRSVGTKSVSLPGSARAFSGKSEKEGEKKKKESGAFRQEREVGKPDADLDDDDVLDRRRRGLTVDETRLKKKKAEAKEEEEEKDDKKDPKKDDKKDSKKGTKKPLKGDKKAATTTTTP